MTQASLFTLSPTPDPPAVACQREGRARALLTATAMHRELLALYRDLGPLTDAEMARELSCERTTVNARRNELVAAGQVRAVGVRKNEKTGVNNTTWGLVGV